MGIPAALVKKIKAERFIDLGDLLPEALEHAFDRGSEERGSDRERKTKFPIGSVTDWALAFATYMAVAVHFRPERAQPLATYMTIITRLAREVTGQVWSRYDRLFRQAAAGNPKLQWDHREPDIWLAALAEQPRRPPTSTGVPSRPSGTRAEGEICRRFSRGECPSQVGCRFRHCCGICQARSHPARDCPLIRPPASRPPPGDYR